MSDLLFQMPLGVQLADILDGQLLRGHFLLLFQRLQDNELFAISVTLHHCFSIGKIQKTNNHTVFLNKLCRPGSDRIGYLFSVVEPEPQHFALAKAEPGCIPVPKPDLDTDPT
jgi:hypothetical protein